MKRRTISTVFTLCVTAIAATGQTLPYQDSGRSAGERAADLLGRLTLEEKTMLMGHNSGAVERLGIEPFSWWSEALHGVARNGYATVFPNPTAMAATFDEVLTERVFTAVSDEARAKNTAARHGGEAGQYQGLSFWTPNINIFRDPRWGRGQETYGEDPFLTSRMGLAVVRGLQGPLGGRYRKALACAKHYAVHSGPEWNRHSLDIEELSERDLWETYLPAFKTLVEEGQVAEVMCAYQRVDGEPCCGNSRLLRQILREEWGFRGIVVSDCWALSDFYEPGRHGVAEDAADASAMAVVAGTDLECGDSFGALAEAVGEGKVTEAEIDSSLLKLLTLRFELGDFDPDSLVEWTSIPESVVACDAHRQLALDMARESIVLLKNDGILPLSAEDGEKIVVVGPNAADSTMLWGNYNGFPLSTTTILQGIRDIAGNVEYVGGCGLTRNEIFDSRYGNIYTPEGEKGMRATYWNNTEMDGAPAATVVMAQPIDLSNGGATVFAPGVNLTSFSARYEGVLVAERSETLSIDMASDDLARLIINGDTIIDSWKSRERANISRADIVVEAGKEYRMEIDYVQKEDMAIMKFDVGSRSQMTTAELLEQVGDATTVVFVGGISPRLEGEEMSVEEPGFRGGDRTDIELPEAQRDAVAALHAAGKKVVFVNCSGSGVGLVAEDSVCSAVVQAWYGGECGGEAVGEVLFGKVNPSGKLPVTFYRSVDQLPDFLDYSMEGRTYRYFEGEPLYAFGYGLSYTTFDIGAPTFGDGKVRVEVRNTGAMEGTETIQLYLRREDDEGGPIKQLRGFKRVTLAPGESKTVEMDMPESRFETWDSKNNSMRTVAGQYQIMVGSSSLDADLKTIEVEI